MTQPVAESDVATALQSAGCGTVGTSILAGPERPVSQGVPVEVIFCSQRAGGPPIMTFKATIYVLRVRVIIRAAPGDYVAGTARAAAALVALHRRIISGYIGCIVLQSAPEYNGANDTGQLRWSFDVELTTT